MKIKIVFIDGEDLILVVPERNFKTFNQNMERKNRIIVGGVVIILRNIAYIEEYKEKVYKRGEKLWDIMQKK